MEKINKIERIRKNKKEFKYFVTLEIYDFKHRLISKTFDTFIGFKELTEKNEDDIRVYMINKSKIDLDLINFASLNIELDD